MIKLFALLALLLPLPLHAATIKSIKGNKATLKLAEDEWTGVENDSSYDMMSKGASVGRIKVSKIFPGRGLVGVLETKTPAINSTSSVKLVPAKEEHDHTLAKAEEEEFDEEEETGIKPTYGRPEITSAKIGWDFNLVMGTHTLEFEGGSDMYASNFGLRGIYKFSGIPLGVGGHLKSNSIKRTFNNGSGSIGEAEFTFSSFGASVMAVQDFGNFRPYALYELSRGQTSLTVRVTTNQGKVEDSADSESYLQHALIMGGAWVIGSFSVGLEYQAFGDMKFKSTDPDSGSSETTVKAKGFSVNLGYSI